MGNYNPHVPQILGQEWVPIREVDLTFSPNVNSVEVGTSYVQKTSQAINNARFYTNQLEATGQFKQCGLVNIYPYGTEDLTGPIKQVIIPVNSGSVTGTEITVFNDGNPGGSVAGAVVNPGFDDYIQFNYNGTVVQQLVDFFFAVNQYPQLANKRILNVSLLYSGSVHNSDAGIALPFVSPRPSTPLSIVRQRNDAGINQDFTPPTFNTTNTGVLDQLATSINNTQNNSIYAAKIATLDLGDINNFWDPAQNPINTDDRMPWRYVDLQRFEASASNRQHIWMRFQIPTFPWSVNGGSPFVRLDYVALQVTYCEERRIAYGARLFRYKYGVNQITLRDPSFNPNPTITTGTYLPTLSWVSPGRIDNGQATSGDFPKLNALRELYQLPSHVGVQVNVPFPLKDHLGETFTRRETPIHLQMSLHSSSATLVDPHAYGRQAAAQVWGPNVVEQEIADDAVGVDTVYTQVRYYARRFGKTENQLSFFNLFAPLSFADITVAQFDALPEIVDGWKEVTLRLSTPITMGTHAPPQPVWRWATTGSTAADRWEILAASAPAISGIAGNLYNLVPTPHQLYEATYQAPTGAVAELAWMPQGVGSPYVTGASQDDSTDAVLIFAQDMPAITGFTVTTLSQSVTGIGQKCGINPCCIPSALAYNRLSWNAVLGAGGMFLPGVAGSYASTPDNVALDITGDIDLRADVTLADWTPANNNALVAKWTSAGDQLSYALVAQSNGTLGMWWSTAGTGASANFVSSTVPIPISLGRLTVRATLDVDSGASRTILFYTAPTMNGPWTQLGAGVVQAGVTSVFSGTAIGEVGSTSVGTGDLTTGTIHAVQIRNGIDGTIAANPNFAAQIPGTTVFTDSAGRVWTLNGAAIIVNLDNPLIGNIEIQRSDSLNSTFQTIMRATNSTISSFNDYEARVGIQSSYRIRLVDVLNFPGPWSSTISVTMASPGVTGGCIGNDSHVLIFTSNERQNGSTNLAYSSVWMDTNVSEDFTFPESDFVQLQLMYDRDFAIAFRPLERGGERFSRTVLVQAAAIPPETLADFQSLRNMAWDTVNYICVRDEDGNRWFATVIVPGGKVINNRKLYLAPVEIIEVTDTPTPVSP